MTHATSSPESEAGPSPCNSPAGPITNPCGPAVVRVSPSPSPGAAVQSLMTGIYGPPGSASSKSVALQLSLESKLRVLMGGNGSPEYETTWSHWDMPSGPPICALLGSARRTFANGSIGWPTPAATDHKGGYHGGRIRDGKLSLDRLDIVAQLAGWPPPLASDGPKGGPAQKPDKLYGAAMLAGWRTPTDDSIRGGAQDPEKRMEGGHTINLQDQARLAVPGTSSTSSPAGTGKCGALNPEHSRWLMGFPAGWSSFADTATP